MSFVASQFPRRRRAFSLLEMLVGIGLILLLSAGVFVFYNYSIANRAAAQQSAEEAQVARAILEQIGDDLKSISAVPVVMKTLGSQRPQSGGGRTVIETPGGGARGGGATPGGRATGGTSTSGGATGGGSTGGGSTGADPLAGTDPLAGDATGEEDVAGGTVKGTAVKAAGAGGLVGSDNQISLQVSRCVPMGRMMYVRPTGLDVQDARPPAFDLQDVQWYWSYDAENNVSNGLWRSHRPSVNPPPAEIVPGSSGLMGDEGSSADAAGEAPLPPNVEESADGEEAPPDLLLVSECVSPEVQWIYIRYWDGSAWTDAFDGTDGKLPVAVEITIGFEPLLTREQFESGKRPADRFKELFGEDPSEPLPPRSYQVVVHVSAGEVTTQNT